MPEIKQQITTGNLLQIGAMLVALSLGWAALDARGASAQKSIEDHELRLRSLERETADRLTRMEAILGRIDRKVGQ
jgi:hypothetical protein